MNPEIPPADCGEYLARIEWRFAGADHKEDAKMGHKPGTHLGGIRTLDDVRARCFVDPHTDCWRWRLHFSRGRSCCVWFLDGVEHKGTASRAAWLLSGKKLHPGWVVSRYRSVCDSPECCNPAHHRAGPKSKVLPKLTPEQRTAHLIGVTRNSRLRAKLNMDAATQIRQSDDTCHKEAAKWGVVPSTISQIRRGETWQELAQGASVFSWRP